MEQLLNKWEERLKLYQQVIDAKHWHENNRSFWKGKKAALEFATEELKNFISFNSTVISSPICPHEKWEETDTIMLCCKKCGILKNQQ